MSVYMCEEWLMQAALKTTEEEEETECFKKEKSLKFQGCPFYHLTSRGRQSWLQKDFDRVAVNPEGTPNTNQLNWLKKSKQLWAVRQLLWQTMDSLCSLAEDATMTPPILIYSHLKTHRKLVVTVW